MNEVANKELYELVQIAVEHLEDMKRDLIHMETRLCKLAVALGQEHVLGNK